jgi:hypothetical protein
VSRFLDGPAAGQTLMNARAPHFLRVITAEPGHGPTLDCLDQLYDVAEPHELVHVYELVPGTYHGVALVRLGRPATCIDMATGDYRHRADVDGESVRDNEAWRAWCLHQPRPANVEVPA